jgi:hypothetical protein
MPEYRGICETYCFVPRAGNESRSASDRPGRTRQLSDYGLWNYETAPDDSNDGGVDHEPVLRSLSS